MRGHRGRKTIKELYYRDDYGLLRKIPEDKEVELDDWNSVILGAVVVIVAMWVFMWVVN